MAFVAYSMIPMGVADHADLVIIETMADPYEMKAAVLGAKEGCNLPIIATMTEVLNAFGITDALVDAADRGALDWVIRARMQAACCRATGIKFDWKGEDQ